MTPTTSSQRHLKYGRFRHLSEEAPANETHPPRRRRWTGYQPLSDPVTQARLAAPIDGNDAETEDKS